MGQLRLLFKHFAGGDRGGEKNKNIKHKRFYVFALVTEQANYCLLSVFFGIFTKADIQVLWDFCLFAFWYLFSDYCRFCFQECKTEQHSQFKLTNKTKDSDAQMPFIILFEKSNSAYYLSPATKGDEVMFAHVCVGECLFGELKKIFHESLVRFH